jgi:hypothetical protein
LRRTDGAVLKATVVLPDAVGTLALKARVRSVRNETRDAEDLWRCLEIAAADGVTPAMFEDDEPLEELRASSGESSDRTATRGRRFSVTSRRRQRRASAPASAPCLRR